MPILIEGSGTEPTEYVAPDDGDFVDGASVQQTIQPAVDALSWLKPKIPGARGQFEILQGLPTPARNFGFMFDPTVGGWTQTSIVTAGDMWIPLGPFPRNQSDAPLYLSEVTVNLIAETHLALPATMPQFSICGFAGGFFTILDSAFVDTSADIGEYMAEHQINGVLSVPIALNFLASAAGALYVKFEGETGLNSVEGLRLISIKVTVQETV